MALGKRPNKSLNSSTRNSQNASRSDADDELLSWSEKNPGQLQGIVVLGSFFVVACLLLLSAPHTYAAKKVNYNTGAMVESSLSVGLLPEYKEKVQNQLGIDFRRILTPASEEKTEAMQRVAKACLPKSKFKAFVMPGREAVKSYGFATDYLICSMTNERARLCESHERHRLVEQLIQYVDRRQNVLGMQRYEDRFAARVQASATAQYQKNMYTKYSNLASKKPTAPAAVARIGTDLDPRIAAGITGLVQNGYLSASDFGWLGLFLPEEYAPILSGDTLMRSCG